MSSRFTKDWTQIALVAAVLCVVDLAPAAWLPHPGDILDETTPTLTLLGTRASSKPAGPYVSLEAFPTRHFVQCFSLKTRIPMRVPYG